MSFPAHLTQLEDRIRARFEAAVGELRRQVETRLRQTHDELVTSLGEITPEDDPLAGLEVGDLDLGLPGRDRAAAFADLLESFRALDRAATQAEALDALLAGSLRFAARAGLLLARDAGARGWGSAGFERDPFGGREIDWSDDLLRRLASGRGAVRLDVADARRFAERLGLARPGEGAVLVPLVLRDRIAAALYADAGEPADLEIEALQLLVLAAADRIELQALTSRGFTPTLYDAERAPGEGLPLWTDAGAPAEEASGAVEATAPPAVDVEPPPAPEPPPPAMAAPPAETFFATAEPESDAWVPEPAPVPIEEEPGTDAGAAGFEVESESDEAVAEPSLWSAEPEPSGAGLDAAPVEELGAAAPEPAPVAPVGEATVRIPVYREPEAPMPPVEDAPAASVEPAPVEEPPAGLGLPGPTTQEIPRAEPEPAPPEPEEDETVLTGRPEGDPLEAPTAAHDVTEDATVLMDRPEVAEPAAAAPAEEVGEDTAERTAARAARSTEVAPPPDVRGPGLAFGAARAGVPTSGENALHDEARRLARLLVSEIKLYNEEQVHEGRRNRDLYIRLREDIDRSRQIYDERVHESVRAETDYFHQELVRSLAGGDSRALGM